MTDFWRIGPTEAEHRLRLAGFTAREAERLVALRLSCDARDAREFSVEQRTVLLQWFLDRGRHDEGLPPVGASGHGRTA